MKVTTIIGIVALLVFSEAYGGNLAAPYALESTTVLPSGVRNPRFLSIHMSMTNRFGETGQVESLGNRLNKQVKWDDVLAPYDDDTIKRSLIESVIKDEDFQSGPGQTTGVVNVYANVNAPVLAMGVSENLTLGLVLPIYKIDVSVDTAFLRSDEGKQFIKALCESSPTKCNEAADKLNNAISEKLSRYNYEPIQSHEISHIGDMMLLGKYRLLKTEKNALTTKLALTFPTGTKANPDKVLDITTGDGRFKVGAAVVYDYYLFQDTVLNFYGGYTAQLPHSMVKRLPTDANDSLADIDSKREVTRKWGDIISLGTALSYPIKNMGLTLTAGYNIQYQSKSRYQVTSVDRAIIQRTRLLEEAELAQTLHSVVTGLGFSTIDWYRSKKFFLPLQLNVVYSHPFAGINVPNNDVVMGELVLFF